GLDPDLNQIYFPVGLALSPIPSGSASGADGGVPAQKRTWLYVANSDFDLQFNAGTVQVFDLDKIGAKVDALQTELEAHAPEPCGKGNGAEVADQFLYPGPCRPLADTGSFIQSQVKIGAFATDILFVPRPGDVEPGPDRLVVPVRGDDTLHWIDTDV